MELVEKVEEDAKEYFRDARPTHDWSHVERVKALSEIIGIKENADLLVLRLSALLHDTERKKEDETNGEVCHAEESERIAREILEKYRVDRTLIEKVCHCIGTHRFRNKGKSPKTTEAKVLYDADKLDCIGAIGVARAYSFGGENNQRLYSNFEECELGSGYNNNWSPVKEFYSKLKKVESRMLTKTGKEIARKRHNFMVRFFKTLERELKGAE